MKAGHGKLSFGKPEIDIHPISSYSIGWRQSHGCVQLQEKLGNLVQLCAQEEEETSSGEKLANGNRGPGPRHSISEPELTTHL